MKVFDEFCASLTSPGDVELHAVQGDGARIVAVRLFAGTEPWPVPEGATGRIGYTLSDGSFGSYDALSDGTPACCVSGNRVEAVIAPGLCRKSGTVKAVIVLEKEDKQISTFPFTLRVEARPGYLGPEGEPDGKVLFDGKIYYGGSDGVPAPLEIGDGLSVVNGVLSVQSALDASVREYVDARIEALRADLQYEPIAINSIAIEPAVAQMGEVIDDPMLVWSLSRDPSVQTVSGQSVDVSLRQMTLNQTFTETESVALTVTDERGGTDSKTATIHFYNAVYYTSHWVGQEIPTDAQLHQMDRKLQPDRGLTIQAASADGEYVLYAIPSRYGTPEFWANGFQGGFQSAGTIAHVNAFGFEEDYSLWISQSSGLNLTITVK